MAKKNNTKDWKNLINDAYNQIDFASINRGINQTVDQVLGQVEDVLNSDAVRNSLKPAPRMRKTGRSGGSSFDPNQVARDRAATREALRNQALANKRRSLLYRDPNKGWNFSSFLMIGGGISAFSFLIPILATGMAFLTGGLQYAGPLIGLIVMMPFFLGSLFLTKKGTELRDRLRRYRLYLSALRGASFATVTDLAQQSAYPEEFVVHDIKQMIRDGYFLQARFVENDRIFLLDHHSYDLYRSSVEKREEKLRVEEELAQEEERGRVGKERDAVLAQLDYVRSQIENKAMTTKLNKLYAMISAIYDSVEENPEQLDGLHEFTSYYIPIAWKLLDRYMEFEKQEVAVEEAPEVMLEIEQTIDTISIACNKLYNRLNEDTMMNVKADISVLKTMLAQEGLLEPDFPKREK